MNRKRIVKFIPFDLKKVDLQKKQASVMLFQAYTPDRHGDRMTPEDIAQAMDFYMANSQRHGKMHTTVTKNFPVRLWQDDQGNGWVTTQYTNEDDFAAVANGEMGGQSWAGYAYVEPHEKEDGTNWLRDPEWWEYSDVDVPAVQSATFKSADTPEELMSLSEQIRSGKVKPRVQYRDRLTAQAAIKAVGEYIKKSIFEPPTSTGGQKTGGIDMTEAELKKLLGEAVDPLVKQVESLTAEVEGIKKTQAEAGKKEPEDQKPEDKEKADETSALTAEDITKAVSAAVAPIATAVTKLEGDLTAVKTDIGKISKQPEASQKIESDGSRAKEQPKKYGWKK